MEDRVHVAKIPEYHTASRPSGPSAQVFGPPPDATGTREAAPAPTDVEIAVIQFKLCPAPRILTAVLYTLHVEYTTLTTLPTSKASHPVSRSTFRARRPICPFFAFSQATPVALCLSLAASITARLRSSDPVAGLRILTNERTSLPFPWSTAPQTSTCQDGSASQPPPGVGIFAWLLHQRHAIVRMISVVLVPILRPRLRAFIPLRFPQVPRRDISVLAHGNVNFRAKRPCSAKRIPQARVAGHLWQERSYGRRRGSETPFGATSHVVPA